MIPHFELPFRFENGVFPVLDQDTADEVTQNVAVLLATIRGEREAVPDFGIDDPLFQSVSIAPNIAEIEDAIETYEPRAAVAITSTEPTEMGDVGVRVTVSIVEPDRE